MDLLMASVDGNLLCGLLCGLLTFVAALFMLYGFAANVAKDPWRCVRWWMCAAATLLVVCAIRTGQVYVLGRQLDGLISEVRELRKLAEELPITNRQKDGD